ncbi:MAG TPA: hypothetical protein VGM93_12415, partial [Acidimicrobiales bacterium]
TWSAARRLATAQWIPPVAAAMAFVSPAFGWWSMTTESAVYSAVLVVAALTTMLWADRRRWAWVGAGALIGLAMCARNDTATLVVPLVVAARLHAPAGRRLRTLGSAAIGLVGALTPLMIANVVGTGQPWGRAAGRMPWLTSYSEIFAYDHTATIGKWLNAGLAPAIAIRRLDAVRFAATLGRMLDLRVSWTVAALVAAGLVDRRLRGQPVASKRWLVPASFLLAQFGFLVLVMPYPTYGGTWQRSAPAVVPFILIAGLEGAAQIGSRATGRDATGLAAGPARLRLGAVVAALAVTIGVVAPPLIGIPVLANEMIQTQNDDGRQVDLLLPVLRREAHRLGRAPVVMTSQSWELNEITGYPAVQEPTDGLRSVVDAARRYGVTHVVMQREKLHDPVGRSLARPGGPCSIVSTVGPWIILRFHDTSPTGKQYARYQS